MRSWSSTERVQTGKSERERVFVISISLFCMAGLNIEHEADGCSVLIGKDGQPYT